MYVDNFIEFDTTIFSLAHSSASGVATATFLVLRFRVIGVVFHACSKTSEPAHHLRVLPSPTQLCNLSPIHPAHRLRPMYRLLNRFLIGFGGESQSIWLLPSALIHLLLRAGATAASSKSSTSGVSFSMAMTDLDPSRTTSNYSPSVSDSCPLF